MGKKSKHEFSRNLKARSNKKNSTTWLKYESALATEEDVPSLARPLPTSPPTKVDLEESLQLTNAYADCMEGERDEVQKISDKNLKRVDVWKATAVSA